MCDARSDGSFSISVPSGSYIVEATHPTYLFDPARVEINSKGKIRARFLNHVQPSAMHSLAYPLRFKSKGRAPYFQRREQWRITDFIFSPMVIFFESLYTICNSRKKEFSASWHLRLSRLLTVSCN